MKTFMRNVLVVFENEHHIESNIQRFVEMLKESSEESSEDVVSIQECNNIITTKDVITANETIYKLIGCGFPYCYDLGDKLYGWEFDCIMIHGDVVLTKKVDEYLKSRMKSTKDFVEFEI